MDASTELIAQIRSELDGHLRDGDMVAAKACVEQLKALGVVPRRQISTVTLSARPDGGTNVDGNLDALHPAWRQQVRAKMALDQFRTTSVLRAASLVLSQIRSRPRARGAGRPGVRRVASRSASSSGDPEEPEPAERRHLNLAEPNARPIELQPETNLPRGRGGGLPRGRISIPPVGGCTRSGKCIRRSGPAPGAAAPTRMKARPLAPRHKELSK